VVCTIAGKWGGSLLTTMCSHLDSLAPVTKGQRSGVKYGYRDRSKSEASKLYFKADIYMFVSVTLIAKGSGKQYFGALKMQIESPYYGHDD
jgi:hypothetical protein